MLAYSTTPIVEIRDLITVKAGVQLLIKREELNHPLVSGNKWWKLKYNLEAAQQAGIKAILTFGGAYSNHIHATAAAAKEYGFDSIGIIRGEETLPLNPTLSFASMQGMRLHYVSRQEYKEKDDPQFIGRVRKKYGNVFIIPEGGSNEWAIKGVKEFAETLLPVNAEYVCIPVGTGATMAGLLSGVKGNTKIVGFPVFKGGEYIREVILNSLLQHENYQELVENLYLDTTCHHGGYGKITNELISFIRDFKERHGILLDPVYTGKMMFGVYDKIKHGYFPPGSTILAIHTGGLQGWKGMEERYKCVKK